MNTQDDNTVDQLDERPGLHVSDSRPKKRTRRHLSESEKECIVNVHKTFQQNHPNTTQTECVNFAASASGASISSVYKVLAEYKKNDVVSPPKKYHRARSVLDFVSDDAKSSIRRKIHQFFFKNEIPTLNKILTVVNNDVDLPTMKRSTLAKLIKEINFRFMKRRHKSFLKESDDIIAWRRRYLREIVSNRKQGRKICYLDETWVNAGHTVSKVWVDQTIQNPRQAAIDGLSTGLKNPSGKGNRLIVLHIGSEDGFIGEDDILVFESKNCGDYHMEMNAAVFENWFQTILPKLAEECVIVMDNASYHSRKVDKAPTTSTKKAEIQEWLGRHNIQFKEDMVKGELLTLVKENKPADKYVVDEMAASTKRCVLRLPPYHCEFNPIELIWAQIKGEVARRNTTFKMVDVKQLFNEAVRHVTPENWKKAVEHVITEEKKMWETDIVMDRIVEPLIIQLNDDSETSDFESDVSES